MPLIEDRFDRELSWANNQARKALDHAESAKQFSDKDEMSKAVDFWGTSQRIIGDAHISLSDAASTLRTLEPALSGAKVAQMETRLQSAREFVQGRTDKIAKIGKSIW